MTARRCAALASAFLLTVLPAAWAEETVEVVVQGQSIAEGMRTSAESVKVIETEQARRESADLGEVLARTEGVSVRRAGGLGSGTRFSLNGLTDDQIRFFLDGVPLELSGYLAGIANIPVNLIERVEIYSGVVPVRFGADALGGAVNLVTPQNVTGTRGGASYEVGSFGTHRLTLSAQRLFEPSGLFVRVSSYGDGAINDYPVDVEVTDDQGRLSPATAARFHDRYLAGGIIGEVGWIRRPWARRLMLRAFATGYDKELQHNTTMTDPYGSAKYTQQGLGVQLRYAHSFTDEISLDAVVGYAHDQGHFLDVDPCIYDWFGQCVFVGRTDGETDIVPHDSVTWDNSGFGRVSATWSPHFDHTLRATSAPTYFTRTGEERRLRNPEARDPLSAERDLLSLVSGLEYELQLLESRLQNILFGKQYYQHVASEDPANAQGVIDGQPFHETDGSTLRFGAGNGLRYRFADWILAKAAYEFATRLPRPDELFGDNVFVLPNLELVPETSHNFNLEAQFGYRSASAGRFSASANGFVRAADRLIVLLQSSKTDSGDTSTFQAYQNVYSAESRGIEASSGWTSPHDYVSLAGNTTYQSLRNTSNDGPFADFEGDRIPNRPYFFANGSVRFELSRLLRAHDELALTWYTRFVRGFYRTWESAGLEEYKQTVPDQLTHSAALVYSVTGTLFRSSASVEVQNITNAKVFDFFGVQRPGRGVYLKNTLEF